MRGADTQTGALFSYLSPDALVPRDHPLQAIRPLVNAALETLSAEFSKLYAPAGRASIAPEKLLRALLLQAFYGVRSERQLMEQITYNMLFRWFVGLSTPFFSLDQIPSAFVLDLLRKSGEFPMMQEDLHAAAETVYERV